jgi:exodeoxyribonuclease VII large subunit
LISLAQLLNALGYHKVLERGFTLVRDGEGHPIRSAAAIAANDSLEIEFADGRVPAIASGGTAPARKRTREPGRGGQGSLFG